MHSCMSACVYVFMHAGMYVCIPVFKEFMEDSKVFILRSILSSFLSCPPQKKYTVPVDITKDKIEKILFN